MSAKLVPTFADKGCHVVSVTDPYGFLDRSHYFLLQVAPQLYSRGWVDSFPDPLLLRKSGSAGNRIGTFGSVARNSDHQTTEAVIQPKQIGILPLKLTNLKMKYSSPVCFCSFSTKFLSNFTEGEPLFVPVVEFKAVRMKLSVYVKGGPGFLRHLHCDIQDVLCCPFMKLTLLHKWI
jgi:hypothetical protein